MTDNRVSIHTCNLSGDVLLAAFAGSGELICAARLRPLAHCDTCHVEVPIGDDGAAALAMMAQRARAEGGGQ